MYSPIFSTNAIYSSVAVPSKYLTTRFSSISLLHTRTHIKDTSAWGCQRASLRARTTSRRPTKSSRCSYTRTRTPPSPPLSKRPSRNSSSKSRWVRIFNSGSIIMCCVVVRARLLRTQEPLIICTFSTTFSHFVRSCVRAFVRAFVRSFVRSFVPACLPSFLPIQQQNVNYFLLAGRRRTSY